MATSEMQPCTARVSIIPLGTDRADLCTPIRSALTSRTLIHMQASVLVSSEAYSSEAGSTTRGKRRWGRGVVRVLGTEG